MNRASWLIHLHPGVFAIPVGLFGLAGAWRRASGFGWHVAADVGLAIATLALVLLLLLAFYAAKMLRYPHALHAEFAHPVAGPVLALIPLALLLCAVFFGEPRHDGWLALVLLALTLQGIVAMRVVTILATGALPSEAVTPVLYLPPVAGGFVGAMALAALGWNG